MSKHVMLDRALCLPALDVAALMQGRIIAVIPNVSVQKGWTFALYSCPETTTEFRDYHSVFLPLAKAEVDEQCGTRRIEAWAKCENCKLLHEEKQIELLSSSTIWSTDHLKQILREKQGLFLVSLRVYRLPQPIELQKICQPFDKVGKFVSLSALDECIPGSIEVQQFLPILKDGTFQRRKARLEALKPPRHVELEGLHSSLIQWSDHSASTKALERDLAIFLEWETFQGQEQQTDSDSIWIQNIADVGNSADGHLFEKLVRKSFIKLGFSNSRNDSKASLDPEKTGGAGGIDFYCDAPFPVVGECKATKNETVPSKTPGQLLQLGKNHLQEDYDPCIKIIIAAGELTDDAELTSVSHQMNVLRPETLQRLVELKAKHPGSVNLVELKSCLEQSPFGTSADAKVNDFIDQIWQQIKVRANLIQAVKELQDLDPNQTQFEVSEIRIHYNNRLGGSGNILSKEAVHEILLELASPLAGYIRLVGKQEIIDGSCMMLYPC